MTEHRIELMSIEQACALTGLTRPQLEYRVKLGDVRHVRIGDLIRIPKTEVERLQAELAHDCTECETYQSLAKLWTIGQRSLARHVENKVIRAHTDRKGRVRFTPDAILDYLAQHGNLFDEDEQIDGDPTTTNSTAAGDLAQDTENAAAANKQADDGAALSAP